MYSTHDFNKHLDQELRHGFGGTSSRPKIMIATLRAARLINFTNSKTLVDVATDHDARYLRPVRMWRRSWYHSKEHRDCCSESESPHDNGKRKIIMSTLESVKPREEAAARCTAKIKRKVLKKQARKARSRASSKMLHATGKKGQKEAVERTNVKGYFTEDRDEWRKELPRHCEEVYFDQEETKENTGKQNWWNSKRKETNNLQKTDNRPGVAIQGQTERQQSKRTRRCDREWDDQKVAHEENLHYCEVRSRTIHGPDGISNFVEDRDTFFRKECPDQRDQKL